MKKPVIALCVILSLSPLCARSQSHGQEWLQDWFKAWELVNREPLLLPSGRPPEMFFYDDTWTYTTFADAVPGATSMPGPGLYGQPCNGGKPRIETPLHYPMASVYQLV